LQGLFIEVGSTPTTVLAKDLGLALDEKGFIKVDENNATNVKGVFAAGDCTTGSAEFRQITTAVGEGTVAAFSAYKSLQVK
jgi:thioredoxin reductase (NADPH)